MALEEEGRERCRPPRARGTTEEVVVGVDHVRANGLEPRRPVSRICVLCARGLHALGVFFASSHEVSGSPCVMKVSK